MKKILIIVFGLFSLIAMGQNGEEFEVIKLPPRAAPTNAFWNDGSLYTGVDGKLYHKQGGIWVEIGAMSTLDVLSNVAQDRIIGRTTAGSGDSEELTASQVRTLLNVEDGAAADQTGAEIVALLVGADQIGAANIATNSISGSEIQSASIPKEDLQNNSVGINQIDEAEGTPLTYLRINAAGDGVEWASIASGTDDQTLSLGGTGNKDLSIEDGNSVDLTTVSVIANAAQVDQANTFTLAGNEFYDYIKLKAATHAKINLYASDGTTLKGQIGWNLYSDAVSMTNNATGGALLIESTGQLQYNLFAGSGDKAVRVDNLGRFYLADEVSLAGNNIWTGINNFNGATTIDDQGLTLGLDEGTNGQRWKITKDPSTNNLRLLYQTSPSTSYTGSYTEIGTINDSGTPTDDSDFVTKGFADANYGGAGSTLLPLNILDSNDSPFSPDASFVNVLNTNNGSLADFTVIIPADSTYDFPVGTILWFENSAADGGIAIDYESPAAGPVFNYSGYDTGVFSLIKRAANSWSIFDFGYTRFVSGFSSTRDGTPAFLLHQETESQIASNGAPSSTQVVLCKNCDPAKVVTSATFDMDAYDLYHYDDSSTDAATITFSNLSEGGKVRIKYNRASAPSYSGATPVQYPGTYSDGAWPANEDVVAVYTYEFGTLWYSFKDLP